MRVWFKYDLGYVNIDSEHVYLTNTGNWSETKDLEEKQQRSSIPWRKLSIYAFLAAVGLIVLFLILGRLTQGTGGLIAIAGIAFFGFRVYNYMKTELGASYRIPKGMISSIELNGTTATIHFMDGDGLQSTELIAGCDRNGLMLLEQLRTELGI